MSEPSGRFYASSDDGFTEAETEEMIRRWAAAQFGHRYPLPRHWKAAAFLNGVGRLWPLPRRLRLWIEANSLRLPEQSDV